MKVYVDFEELDVEDRPHYICNKYNLQVKSINSGTRYDNVKLISLSNYAKQVRKEVCDEIISKGKIKYGYSPSHKDGIKQVLEIDKEILDQIQGETK